MSIERYETLQKDFDDFKKQHNIGEALLLCKDEGSSLKISNLDHLGEVGILAACIESNTLQSAHDARLITDYIRHEEEKGSDGCL